MCFVRIQTRISVYLTVASPHIPHPGNALEWESYVLYLFANEETVLCFLSLGMLNLHGSVNVVGGGVSVS
jgi:hypothetical protein